MVFSIFSNIDIYKNPGKTKHTMCTPKGWLNVSTALVHNYVEAAGLALGRHSVLRVNPPLHVLTVRHQFRAASFMWVVAEDVKKLLFT